jgi:1,4-dihydroxy-6-naphthoate synthase
MSLSAQKAGVPRPPRVELKLAHSPDSDDAFMFYGLATQKLRTGDLAFAHIL